MMRLVAVPALLSLGATANAGLLELKAVAVNGMPLAEPTAKVDIEPGDEVTAELYLSGWASDFERLRTFQTTILGIIGSTSGDTGTVLPKGWPNTPELGAFEDVERPDWVFAAFENVIAEPSTFTLDYKWGALIFESDGVIDNGTKFYAGTYILVASADACGTFTFNWDVSRTDRTFIEDSTQEIRVVPETVGLEINVACAPTIVNSCADNCAIDARYPHDANFFSLRWDQVNLRLDNLDVPIDTLDCLDFAISFAGGPGILLRCLAVNATGPDTLEYLLDNTIPTSRWTCVELRNGQPAANQTCLASLPGDVNADRRSDGGDALALVEHMTLGTPLEQWQCDIDRDGNCNQLDTLALVDMLLGVDPWVPWLGATLSVECPTASHDAPCGDLSLPQ